jgi:hypothetical protein
MVSVTGMRGSGPCIHYASIMDAEQLPALHVAIQQKEFPNEFSPLPGPTHATLLASDVSPWASGNNPLNSRHLSPWHGCRKDGHALGSAAQSLSPPPPPQKTPDHHDACRIRFESGQGRLTAVALRLLCSSPEAVGAALRARLRLFPGEPTTPTTPSRTS